MPTTIVPFQRQAPATAPVPAPVPAHVEPEEFAPRLFTDQEDAPLERQHHEMAELRYGLGTREEIQAELDSIGNAIRLFHTKAADEVMEECSAYSARLTELYVLLHRVESTGTGAGYSRVRTQQVDIYRTEIEFQFKIASRKVEILRQDLALLGGQP